MKAVVAYDSYYGNTKLVAEAIREQIRTEGLDGELKNVREDKTQPQGDVLFVGSPIRMGSASGRIKRYVKRLDRDAWKDKPIVVFSTVALMPKEPATEDQKRSYDKWALNGGRKLRDLAKARGLNVLDKLLWVEVKDSKGPLVEEGLEKTKQFAHEILQTIKK